PGGGIMAGEDASPAVWVVGVGPGDPALIHEAARVRIETADAVAGFRTVLDRIAPWLAGRRCVELTYRNQKQALAALADDARRGRCRAPVVVAWGDPSVSGRQLVEEVARAFAGWTLRVLPGVSALQLALARTGLA